MGRRLVTEHGKIHLVHDILTNDKFLINFSDSKLCNFVVNTFTLMQWYAFTFFCMCHLN